jgi:hypothetical protein
LGIWGDFRNLGNLYACVGSNPWSFIDPFGLAGQREWWEMASDPESNYDVKNWGVSWGMASTDSELAQEIVSLTEVLGCAMEDSDSRHAALDAAGLVGDSAGGLGFLFDGANAIAYAKEGDLWNAGISLAAMVPFIGDTAKGLRYGDEVGETIARTVANSTRGWKVGEAINNLTAAGNVPTWSTVQARYWKNQAYYGFSGQFTDESPGRMQRGLARQEYNLEQQTWESIELHHNPAQRNGGLFDFSEVLPDEHAGLDPWRNMSK